MNSNQVEEYTASDLMRGLIYTHNRVNTDTVEVHQPAATLHALVRLLVQQRFIDCEALNEPDWPMNLEIETTAVNGGC